MPGPFQIFVIFLAILLLFGAKRIPEIASSLAKGIKEFKKVGKDSDDKEVISESKSEAPKDKEENKA